jgi:Type IIA topoisomerase (DNA gyrase/topo II, topoisomerase IV), B subunit
VKSIKIPEPKSPPQTKEKWVPPEVRKIGETVGKEKKSQGGDQNPSMAKNKKAKNGQAALAREVARKARENVRRKGALEKTG